MKDVSINIDFLNKCYFCFDDPIPYKVDGGEILITPVLLKPSEIFLSSLDILNIDKNSLPDVKIIQMSYLQFICQVLLSDEQTRDETLQKLTNILILCLGFKQPSIFWRDERTPCLCDKMLNVTITPKQFDEIKRIIMYQNIPHFNDEYVNPELKKAMSEEDAIRNQDKEVPSLERKMAIITAHTGLSKKEQQEMTLRSHSLLFEEVCGEVEFTTTRAIALLNGNKNDLEHWIFKKPKGKFEGYTRSVDSYTNKIGGAQAIRTTDSSFGDSLMQQFNNFSK